jgi:hypothetical protein
MSTEPALIVRSFIAPTTAASVPPHDEITEQNAASILKQQAEHAGNCAPPELTGRGVVIVAGGNYAPSAWVNIKMLRHHGCNLPVQVWHIGPAEITDKQRAAFTAIGVELVDVHEAQKIFPHPRLNGWETKAYALLHSNFREVIFLDADNIALADPTALFDTPEYQATGALFWPDRGRWPAHSTIWQVTGLPYQDESEFESGQIVVDKMRCWAELVLANEINKDSAFWFHHIHGDKDTFRLAWRLRDRAYTMFPHPSSCHPSSPAGWGVFCQKNMAGEPIFWHGHKWAPTASRSLFFAANGPAQKYAKPCLKFIEQYEALMNGTPAETALVAASVFDDVTTDAVNFDELRQKVEINRDWAIDDRHVQWIYATLRAAKPQAIIEIGCFQGASTLAFMQALDKKYVQRAHLIDVNIQQSVKDLARPGVQLYETYSTTALPTIDESGDIAILVDGDHSYNAVAAELPLVLAKNPRIIIAHDVNATAVGYGDCEGPAWLWSELQAKGWTCVVDCSRRYGELTHRGLLIAAKDAETIEAIRKGFADTCLL